MILASQSKARRRLLRRLGLSFRCIPADLDEAFYARSIDDPRKLVLTLARLKAQSISVQYPRAVVIGSDQVLLAPRPSRRTGPVTPAKNRALVFGKPLTFEKACAQLRRCSGQTIRLLTAVHVEAPSFQKTWVHETKMKFRVLSKAEIEAYVRRDQPLECAGSFMFEKHGISLFESVQTDDPTAIEGLPLLSLHTTLLQVARAT